MSFVDYKKCIEEGDDIIIYVGYKVSYHVTIKWGDIVQTKFGALRHEYAIGKPYGSKIQCTKGYVYILHPTPELWTQNVDHRTQILYPPDINHIIFGLEIRPGSVIGEAGTGSGALSHAMARAIHPGGHLWTFDFHEVRADMARDEFTAHNLGHLISVAHRDVCTDGFGDALDGQLDGVFLDLPKPWEALPFAKKALKDIGGRVCCFSPCIEQTQRNSLALHRLGFIEVTTVELVIRQLKITEVTQLVLKPNPVRHNLVPMKGRKEQSSKDTTTEITGSVPASKRQKLQTDMVDEEEVTSCNPEPTVRSKDITDCSDGCSDNVADNKPDGEIIPKDRRIFKKKSAVATHENGSLNEFTSVIPYPVKQPTHSGFLTFATLPPVYVE